MYFYLDLVGFLSCTSASVSCWKARTVCTILRELGTRSMLYVQQSNFVFLLLAFHRDYQTVMLLTTLEGIIPTAVYTRNMEDKSL